MPRESSDGLAKPPRCRVGCRVAAGQGGTHPRFAPAARRFERVAQSVPIAGASPRPLQDALASRKRYLSVVNLQGCRAYAGFPPAVRSPGLSALPPTTAAQGGYKGDRENSTWHQGGTRTEFLAACATAALQRRFARCHYLLHAKRTRHARSRRDLVRRTPAGSDSA